MVLGVREHKRRVSGIRRESGGGLWFLLCLTSFATTKPRPSKARQSKSPHAHGSFTEQSLPGHAHMNFSGRLDPNTGKPHQQLEVTCDQGHTAFTSKGQGTPEPLAGLLPGFWLKTQDAKLKGERCPGVTGSHKRMFLHGLAPKTLSKAAEPLQSAIVRSNPCSKTILP